jgi:iron(III) transport system ATP-binding protein
MIATEPLLKLNGISKRFGTVNVLKDVRLDVEAGSFTCLVGPSGCGKTTLLRTLCGLETVDNGAILCGGRDITHTPASARKMGLVFQSYALFPNLTVGRNIAYGLPRHWGRRQMHERVEMLLDTVGLNGFAKRRPEELSGGQQQRVAIARALAPEPSVLLLDEPLSALDAQLRLQLRGELKSLQKRLGVTTIMVTHDQAEAMAVADRIAVMQHGRIAQIGSPFELYCHPASRFVAGFVGHMSFLPAKVSGPGKVQLAHGLSLLADTGSYTEGAEIEVGIRPEDVALCEDRAETAFAVRVLRREFLGGAMRLEAVEMQGGSRLTLDLPQRLGRTISEGAEISVVLPSSRLHIFPLGQR